MSESTLYRVINKNYIYGYLNLHASLGNCSEFNELQAPHFVCCADDGLDRPPLSAISPSYHQAHLAVHRNGDNRCVAAWGRGAAFGF